MVKIKNVEPEDDFVILEDYDESDEKPEIFKEVQIKNSTKNI